MLGILTDTCTHWIKIRVSLKYIVNPVESNSLYYFVNVTCFPEKFLTFRNSVNDVTYSQSCVTVVRKTSRTFVE